MKTVYPAHPIGGDVENNVKLIRKIVRMLHFTPGIMPVAPYMVDVQGVLDDDIPSERAMGLATATEYFKRGMIDEVWLYGPRISNGMRAEVLFAWDIGIPVRAITSETKRDLLEMHKESLIGQI